MNRDVLQLIALQLTGKTLFQVCLSCKKFNTWINNKNFWKRRLRCKIIADLKFIGQIEKGYKPNFSDRTFATDWLSNFKRFWKGENREEGFRYIDRLITEISHFDDLESIKEFIPSAIIGIKNLGSTYYEYRNSFKGLSQNLKFIMEGSSSVEVW